MNNIRFDKFLFKNPFFKKCKVVASFLSINSEISTDNLNNFIEQSQKILCLPIITDNDNNVLVFGKYSVGDLLANGKYGTKEPLNHKFILPDILFIPCLAFDISGFRLGYGGGYYDKTISYLKNINHKFVTIGFAYDDQKVNNVEHDILDQKLDYILTEKQLYEIL